MNILENQWLSVTYNNFNLTLCFGVGTRGRLSSRVTWAARRLGFLGLVCVPFTNDANILCCFVKRTFRTDSWKKK